ncbi:unnamed protein product [Linum trigynum]|uniref:Uncharacterized protein n=1 Tax=Linum trigynum TaxID=586398 RepID=A0AAV2FDJ3_9ROSI
MLQFPSLIVGVVSCGPCQPKELRLRYEAQVGLIPPPDFWILRSQKIEACVVDLTNTGSRSGLKEFHEIQEETQESQNDGGMSLIPMVRGDVAPNSSSLGKFWSK